MIVYKYMIRELSIGVERELIIKIYPSVVSISHLIAFLNCSVIGSALLKLYKQYPPIELLPADEKLEIKEFIIKNYPGRSREELTDRAKMLYTINYLFPEPL